MIITEIRVLIWKLLTKSLYPAYISDNIQNGYRERCDDFS